MTLRHILERERAMFAASFFHFKNFPMSVVFAAASLHKVVVTVTVSPILSCNFMKLIT